MILGASLDAVYPGRYTEFGVDSNEWKSGANACWVIPGAVFDNSAATLRIFSADHFDVQSPGKGFRKTTIADVGDQAVLLTKSAAADYLYVRAGEHAFVLTFDKGLEPELEIVREIIKRLR